MEFLAIAIVVIGWLWFKAYGRSRDKETLIPFGYWLSMYDKERSSVRQSMLASTLLFQALHVVDNLPDSYPELRGLQRRLSSMPAAEKNQIFKTLLTHARKMPSSITNEIASMQARVAMSIILIDWSKTKQEAC